MNNKRELRWIVIIITIIILSGCAYSHTNQKVIVTPQVFPKEKSTQIIIDSGFLSSIPCSAPCFFDSTPGTTKKDELFKNLMKYNINPSCTEKQLDDSQSISNCDQGFFFSFYDSVLTKIIIEPNSIITLGQVIEKYGSPEDVNLRRGGINELNIDKLVYFESSQFILHFTDPGESDNSGEFQNSELLKDSIVLWIDYVDQDTYKMYLDDCTIPWKGYGSYELKPGC